MILNLCPHPIAVIGDGGAARVIDPGGQPVRIETQPRPQVAAIDGIPIHGPSRFMGIANLPAPIAGTIVVVSQIAAMAIAALHPDRTDVVYPGTSRDDQAIRDRRRGRVVAVSRLIRAV